MMCECEDTHMDTPDFRFGNMAQLYYELAGTKLPKQLDLIDAWFPGLIIAEDDSDGESKTEAFYVDQEYMIHAVRYHGRLYAGSSTRVSQICGRLIGTASGNKEKERKASELIQKHVAECFIRDMTLTPRLQENTARLLGRLTQEQQSALCQQLTDLVYALARQRAETDDYDRKTELFSMDDETFDGTIYNCAYQLNLGAFRNLCNAYLWLLAGSLLRSEIGRVIRLYDSAFIAVRRQISETGELKDKLDNLFHHEEYCYTFDGDEEDFKNRFPNIEWYCDGCGAHLNEQEGFDDHLPEWKCRACGHGNRLDLTECYDNDEDWKNHIRPLDRDRFEDALRRRKLELGERKRQEEQKKQGGGCS